MHHVIFVHYGLLLLRYYSIFLYCLCMKSYIALCMGADVLSLSLSLYEWMDTIHLLIHFPATLCAVVFSTCWYVHSTSYSCLVVCEAKSVPNNWQVLVHILFCRWDVLNFFLDFVKDLWMIIFFKFETGLSLVYIWHSKPPPPNKSMVKDNSCIPNWPRWRDNMTSNVQMSEEKSRVAVMRSQYLPSS